MKNFFVFILILLISYSINSCNKKDTTPFESSFNFDVPDLNYNTKSIITQLSVIDSEDTNDFELESLGKIEYNMLRLVSKKIDYKKNEIYRYTYNLETFEVFILSGLDENPRFLKSFESEKLLYDQFGFLNNMNFYNPLSCWQEDHIPLKNECRGLYEDIWTLTESENELIYSSTFNLPNEREDDFEVTYIHRFNKDDFQTEYLYLLDNGFSLCKVKWIYESF